MSCKSQFSSSLSESMQGPIHQTVLMRCRVLLLRQKSIERNLIDAVTTGQLRHTKKKSADPTFMCLSLFMRTILLGNT